MPRVFWMICVAWLVVTYPFVVDKEIVKQHAQRWDPETNVHRYVNHASRVEGMGTELSAWAADE